MEWIVKQIQQIFTGLSYLFNVPLFNIGGKLFSLTSFFQLILLAIVVFILAGWISDWIKVRLLIKMERGTREAIAAVSRYILTSIGLIIVLQTAGINLSSLTVFAGVLGIGFGFGLQNLASNFISGLTLLFERPIKVGDFVEVNSLLGTVEQISIRSTIVRTIDGVSVIVPNNRFVENNIINWSHSDPNCRIHIPVGVAYGSDPLLVTETLLAAARIQPNVLSSPPPKVWFKRFGENALDFDLLVWINEPQEIDRIKSDLNFLIEHELRRQGIEIPFPQRDLHIRNLESLGALFHKSSATDVGNSKIQPRDTTVKGSPLAPKSPDNWTLRDLLQRVTYFEQCSDLELRQLIEYGYRQLFPAGQVICQENDPGESFYIILSGSVEVLSQRAGQYIATLHEGEFFGEISLLMGTPRTATVRTVKDTILFVVERHDLQRILSDHQELADQIAQKLSERQQVLRELGLLIEEDIEETPFIRIRKHIQSLFGI